MLLLASYFPYQMSRGEDGAWRFWNRNGFPVGVNLSEGERGWDGGWDPRWSMELPKLDAAAFRKVCCPEWLVDDGTPRADDDELTLIGDNPVTVDVNDPTRTLHNVTEDGHIFHNPAQSGCPHRPGSGATCDDALLADAETGGGTR